MKNKFIGGGKKYKVTNTDNWSNNPMRTWMNTNFINALPTTLQPLIKQVTKKSAFGNTTDKVKDTQDKAFWLSYPEVFSTIALTDYLGNGKLLEGTQYQYYKTASNRIKNINNNGIAQLGTNSSWWLRSLGNVIDTTDGLRIVFALYDVNNGTARGQTTYGTTISTIYSAPAFCL